MNLLRFLFVVGCCYGLTDALEQGSPGRRFILDSVEEAKKIVDAAYKYSRDESLSRVRKEVIRPSDKLRLVKQPARKTREAVRAADYMEQTLRLISEKAHHAHKRSINVTDLLTPDELHTITRLTGCASQTRAPSCRITPSVNKYRTATSVCNNRRNPLWGASNTAFVRWLPPIYEDGISQPSGWDPNRLHNGATLPLVRLVSNRILSTADADISHDSEFTFMLTIFGQWVDHDLTLTPFSPSIKSFSNGLNCDESCARSESCFPILVDSSRRLKIQDSSLAEVSCLIAGDPRVDENIALTSLHTLFVREHNRLARALHVLNPTWSSETLYQETRKIVGAYQQVLVIKKYLPHIVGQDAYNRYLGPYPGYNENVDPSIANVFATAAFRFAHLAIQPILFRLDENYKEHPQFPSVFLHEAFFSPWRVIYEGGIDPLLRGLIGRPSKLNTQDHMLVDALREKLFAFTSHVALDLAALNMQRSRDHGIPGYNAWRRFCGLSAPRNEQQLALVMNNSLLARKFIELYRTPENIDVWLGGVAEPFVPGGRVGPLFACLISKQFQHVRDGDRLWWENQGVFTSAQQTSLNSVSLARIICDNTGISDVPADPFRFSSPEHFVNCSKIPAFDLNPWIETVSD